MRKLSTMFVICAVALGAVSVAAAQPRAARRQHNQQARIAAGTAQGQITPAEGRQLDRQQHRIARHEHRVAADGKVTPRERASVERQQNRASRHIARARHNARTTNAAPAQGAPNAN